MRYPTVVSFVVCIAMGLFACATQSPSMREGGLPDGFVYLNDVDSSIIEEMRYHDTHNFVGRPIRGYVKPRCILTRPAAENLAKVQAELKAYSMSLKVYDCYRPQKAVNHFVDWAKDLNDNAMKTEFYPQVDKSHLFRDGYIAEKSGHSRGSTVDLTIVALPAAEQEVFRSGMKLVECFSPAAKRFKDNSLDFGTGYDCFDTLSHTANPKVSSNQKLNRLMLKSILEKNGFKNLAEEWWHYTYRNEPFPDQYFDFDVK